MTAIIDNQSIDNIDDIIERAQAGEVAAFEIIYREHVNKVYSLCYRMTVNKAHAEELTQEAFVRVWQKIKQFAGKSSFSTWLHRLVTNVVISQLRKKNLIDEKSDFDILLSQRAAQVSETTIAMDLESAILQLPTGARQVFVLHDVEGYKHSEISAMIGIAEGTSKTQLHRSRKLLREWMA